MHYLYEKQTTDGGFRFTFKGERSLAGRNKGMIPHLLEIHLAGTGDEPLHWHFVVQDVINRSRWPSCALIINLKPNDPQRKLSLYEIVEAWGHSCRGWTPIMLRLRGLFVDQSPGQVDPRDFIYESDGNDTPIFSLMYMRGTVRDGQLEDKWTLPGPSSTNSVLLWPETLSYFAEEADKIMHPS